MLKARAENTDKGVGVSRNWNGRKEERSGHHLISQSCLELLPGFKCVFVELSAVDTASLANETIINKSMHIIYFIQVP